MKASELRDKSDQDLIDLERQTRDELFRLKMKHFTGQLQKLDFKGPVTQSGIYNDDYTMTTFSLESVIDTKDRAIFPQNGNYQRIF